MNEKPEQPPIPAQTDTPSSSFCVRNGRALIAASVLGVVSAGGLFVACREPEEVRLERQEVEEQKRYLRVLESMCDDILSAKDFPEDLQEAEVDEAVRTFAIAYAFEELGWWPGSIRELPLLDRNILQNMRVRQIERNSLVGTSDIKLKEGMVVAVLDRREGKAIPVVMKNEAGIPVIDWGDRFTKK